MTVTGFPDATVTVPAPAMVMGATPLAKLNTSGLFAAVVRPFVAEVVIVPVDAVPVPLKPCPLARVSEVVSPVTSKVEPPANMMFGEFAIEPVLLKASFPVVIVVSPL